jgi:hypothetical protein
MFKLIDVVTVKMKGLWDLQGLLCHVQKAGALPDCAIDMFQ